MAAVPRVSATGRSSSTTAMICASFGAISRARRAAESASIGFLSGPDVRDARDRARGPRAPPASRSRSRCRMVAAPSASPADSRRRASARNARICVGFEREDLAVERDRALGRRERLFFEKRPLGENGDARRARRSVRAQAEEPTQIVASIGRGSKQPIERGDCFVVVRVGRDELAVGADRVFRAAVGRRDLRQDHAERSALVVAGIARSRARFESSHEEHPLARHACPVLELADGAGLVRGNLEDLGRVAEGRRAVGEFGCP